MTVELVPIDALTPAAYNPREVIDDRLAMIRLSLAKLGFLLPLYASPSGEVLSGHQRQTAARELGAARLPVARVPAMDLGQRKVVNIIFNRATNDMGTVDTPTRLAVEAQRAVVLEAANALPDLDPLSDAFFPIVGAQAVSVKTTLDANRDRPWPRQAARMAGTLRRTAGVLMPIVVDEDGRVVNGMGRLRWMAGERMPTAAAVIVTREQGRFADAMHNLVSMEFDLRRYADMLRHNSFRRSSATRRSLGQGFLFAVHKGRSRDFDLARPADRERWTRMHGRRIVDFGAGHMHETHMLRRIGVEVAAFEPYPNGGGNAIDRARARELTSTFLSDVATGRPYSSVFCSSVLNSVPFREDREHIMVLLAALCGRGRVYLCARSTDDPSWHQVNGADFRNERFASQINFRLDYEPGITVGNVDRAPKVQKFHTAAELRALAELAFADVRAGVHGHNAVVIARSPRADVLAARLDAAIAFEFDLPYPDGQRLGLVDEAREAFAARLSA